MICLERKLDMEFKKIAEILISNGYPEKLILNDIKFKIS